MSNSMVKILRKWGQKLYDEFGVGHSYYGITNACNFAADELEKKDARIAELEAQLAEADAVIKPFAELSKRVDTRGFDYISLDVTSKSIKSAAEYIRKRETHANPA